MSNTVLELEVELRTTDLSMLKSFLKYLERDSINVDISCDYSSLRESQKGFKTVLRFLPYQNGVSIKDDVVCKTLLERLEAFAESSDVLSYSLRRSRKDVVSYAKIS